MRDTARKRKLEGVAETEMEVNIDPEVANAPKAQYAKDYGYTLQRHEILWSHLLGRLRKEIDMSVHYTLP